MLVIKVFPFHFYIPVWSQFTQMGAEQFAFAQQLFRACTLKVYIPPSIGSLPTPGYTELLITPLIQEGYLLLLPSYLCNMVGYIPLAFWQNQLITLPGRHGGEGSSSPGLVQPDGIVNSKLLVDVKPGNSSVVIGYQVDNYSHLVARMYCCLMTNLPWVHG